MAQRTSAERTCPVMAKVAAMVGSAGPRWAMGAALLTTISYVTIRATASLRARHASSMNPASQNTMFDLRSGAARLISRTFGLVEDLRQREDRLALVLSVLVGALVGLVVVAFVLLTGRLAARIYPTDSAAWRRILAPTAGALVTGILLVRAFPDARGSGIPQTRAAIFIHNGRITFRTVIGKFTCCVISLASGIALGREGPSVHLGSGIASVMARRLGLSGVRVQWLVPVGAAAALAAAFNTPIAAVLFALEEIVGDMHAPILGSIVLSSVTSWMMLHLVLGDEPLFHVTGYHLVSSGELGAYVVLGIVGGLCSVAFVRLLLAMRKRFLSLPASTRWIQPAVGGLTVGLIGYYVPQVLGVGYDQVDRVLDGEVVLRLVLMLGALKIFATAICYASGNAGGIFGPSMFIGAMLGGGVGAVVHQWFPSSTAGPGAYALVGMGTAFAGVIRTPLTSVIMIFEVTRNYSIIVPLMISNLIAFAISRALQRESIYEALAHQDGLHLPSGSVQREAKRLLVRDAMLPAPAGLAASGSVADAYERVQSQRLPWWPVEDGEGFVALVRTRDIERAMADGLGDVVMRDLISKNLSSPARPSAQDHLHADQPMALVLGRMGESRRAVLPVVSRSNTRVLVGLVALRDVLHAYGVGRKPELNVVEVAAHG